MASSAARTQTTRWLQATRPSRLLNPRPATIRHQNQNRTFHLSAPLLTELGSSPSTPTTPALLSTLKQDLKTAMRSKDAPRLSVLRSVINIVNNAAKTATPVTTDVQLLGHLRRQLRSVHDAADEARAADRPDLAEKEDAQAAVLEAYIAGSGVERVSEADVAERILAIIAEDEAKNGKAVLGNVMKRASQWLQGRDSEVEMKSIAKMVKDAIGGK